MAASVTTGRALSYARGSARGLLHHWGDTANACHGVTRPEPERLDHFRTLTMDLPKQPA